MMYWGDWLAIGIISSVASFIGGYVYGAWKHIK